MHGRVSRIVRSTALVASLGLCGVGFAADEIHWTITGPTSVTFDWRGTPSENTISYGLSAGSYTSTVTAANPSGVCVPWSSAGPFWEAPITGLAADTLYHYAIANGPDHTFRTPPPATVEAFDVLVEGDIGDSAYYTAMGPLQQQMAQETSARLYLMVGDLTYGDDHGQSHVDQHFNDVMPWSQDVAYMPAWGNHEWDSEPADDLRNYKGRFDFANPQTSVGTPSVSNCGEDWYWFDYGNTRFIAYPEPWTGAWDDWNTQATSIMNAAQADPNVKWIVTFGHRPAYSTGHHSGSSTLQSYLGALGLAHSKYVLNVNGHSHDYERSFPQNGVVHVTAGTGGSVLETDGPCLWLTCDQPAWSAVRYFHFGYLKLAFTPTSIQGSFVCGPASDHDDVSCTPGTVLDTFTIVPTVPSPVIYVDKANPQCTANGSGTPAQPFCTINDGIAHAVAGNTVLVKAGTYSEDVKITKSGTSTAPLVVKAEPGANVVVSGQFRGFEISGKSWITVQGFTVSDTASYGIYVATANHITIANNHVSRAGLPANGSTKDGIYLTKVSDSVVTGNTADYNSDAGIGVVNGSSNVTISGNVAAHNARGYTRAAPGIDVRSPGNVIKGNISHDNEDSGIQVFAYGSSQSPNNLIVDNLCYANGDHGIDISSAGSQTVVGNTVYLSTTAGINVEGTATLPSSGTTLRNNISVNNAVGSTNTKGNIRVDSFSTPGTTIDYDLVYQGAPGYMIVWGVTNYPSLAAFTAATGQEAHGIQADPKWRSISAADFHLAPGSPAIDSADSGAPGQTDTDLEGQGRADDPLTVNTGAGPRTYDDRGAFEHPICGNGIKEAGEDCDGSDTGNAVCATLGCGGGNPTCTSQCTLDYGTCTGCPVCGNGVKEFGEDCDGSDLGGVSCESMGQCSIGGGLACTSSCHFNTSGCSCGDAIIQGGCGEVCDGSNLAGQTCVTRGFPEGGSLTCQSNCAAFDTSACNDCGDGIRQPDEQCDGSNLNGATCSSQGCASGAPTCTSSCTISYANCSNCWGGLLYVDRANPACTDAGQGTAAAPFCTINGAAFRVLAGGTVIVASGTYPEYVKVLASGTSIAPITFKAAPGATVNVTGQTRGFEISSKSWIVIDGFNISSTTDYGIYLATSSNVTIQNNHVSFAGTRVSSSTTKPGIYVSATTNALISGNTTQDNSDSGIYVTSGSTNVTVVGNTSARNARGYTSAACGIEIRSSGNFVRGNICHDNEHSGIIVQPFSGSTPVPQNRIVNNVTYANTVHGIQLKYSDNSQIVGNTVYGNGGSGIDLSGASSQCVVANNISVDNATGLNGSSYGNFRVEAASVSGTTLDYDLMYRSGTGTMVSWNGTPYASLSAFKTATSQEAHGLQAAPQWVAQASADFRLKIGSPAIDSANSAATGAADTDIVGTPRTDDRATANTGAGPRTYDDRGAYEYPLDADHDGYASDEDCDDLNPAINPGLPDDTCDGIDDNCNGQVDEGYVPVQTTCGVGACAAFGATACVNHVVVNNCTPGTPAPNDTTCDGIDDNCNGQTDEGYVPTPSVCGVGACAATGQNICVNGVVTNSCTPGTPAPADANTTCDGIDDDCNGQTDEGYVPTPSTCGVGACAATGQHLCVNGAVTDTCTPGTPAPSDDDCNGIDDNCNGQTDEGYAPMPTACGVGACAATGQLACINGTVTDTCTPGHPAPSDTTCNGVDDDCNGQVDDGYVPTATTCGVGACAANGQNVCVNGAVVNTCTPGTPAPSDATCDGIDDDCDGQTDEDYAPTASGTTCGVGACAATGRNLCINGTIQDVCTPGAPAVSDTTCNGIDDNCDGQIDEGYVATPTACGVGACAATGQKVCVNGAVTDTCTPGSPAPADATCDGIDDDCDGQTDEDYVPTATTTTCGIGACAATGQNLCVNGVIQDVCTPGTPAPTDATCNGIDDNCNGQVDEGYVATATACGVGACASTGQTICVNGTIVDTCTPGTPVPEIGCDGIDNDCNPATPDVMDGDGDGVTCATDCNDADASIYPGAPEINDGKDNQCPGNPGYGLVDETSGDSGFHTAGVKTEYSWPAQGGATAYEVARAGSADFNLECQTAQTAGPSWSDTQNPAAGKVFFYLNRPSTPFAGSWGARSSGAQRTVSCAAP